MRRFYNAIIGTCSVLFLWGSVEAAGAEQSVKTRIDSTVVELDNGDVVVKYSVKPFDFGTLHHPDPAQRRSLVFSEEEKNQHFDTFRASQEAIVSVRKSPRRASVQADFSDYAVGEIPMEAGVSPTGARTYQIPIVTAAGFKLTPSIALGYNSQAGEGWVGYGWDIQGLSTISLINKNVYYHGVAKGASVEDKDAVFALDGVPLVRNSNSATSSAYPLETASGHILVAPEKNSQGYVVRFTALYPNGLTVVYGAESDNAFNLPSYPAVESRDLDGNKIEFDYYLDLVYGNHRISSIRYGFDPSGHHKGEIEFDYAIYPISIVRYCYGAEFYRNYRVASIVSKNNGDVIGRYSLSYDEKDNEFLLSNVGYSSGSELLRPLEFVYGEEESEQENPDRLCRDSDFLLLSSAFTQEEVDLYYRRGKFVANSFNDGLLIYPNFPEYGVTDHYKPLFGHNYYEFGSLYPKEQKILFAPSLSDYNDVDGSIITGEGFQTIEAVDVNGDGIDEIVKVNFNGTVNSYTKLLITVYKCNSTGIPVVDYSFTVLVNGVHSNKHFTSPARRSYYWGDFSGNGKAQLLTIAYDKNYNNTITYDQVSYAALIDISGKRKLSEEELFAFPIDKAGCLITCDIDNDTRTELCYATTSGLEVYRLSSNNTFRKEATYGNVNSDILSSESRPYYIADVNGDGYIDILRAPSVGTSSLWTDYAFTGTKFETFYLNIASRAEEDVFMFMDVNRDGLADLVKVSGTTLGTYMNQDKDGFGAFMQSPSSVTNTKGIIPANVVDYMGMSSFIKVDGFYVYEYYYTSLSPKKRHLTKSVDSFGKTLYNTYTYLPENSLYWTDNSVSVTNSDGYAQRTLPIYVLSREEACQSDDNPSTRYLSKYYSYYNGVVHNKGLGFCGFSKIRSYDDTGSVVDIVDQVLDPEKRGVATKAEARHRSVWNAPYSTTINTYDNNSTTYGKLNPRLTKSVSTDVLTGIETTVSYSYDNYDYPISVLTSRRVGSGAEQTEKLSRTYQHNVASSKYMLGILKEESVVKKDNGKVEMAWKERSVTTYDDHFRPLTNKKYVGIYGSPRTQKGGMAVSGVVDRILPIDSISPPSMNILDATNLVSEVRWQYDDYGNVISEKTAPYGAEEFLGDTYVYDEDGRYILSKTDALGHTTTYGEYDKFGNPETETDYRGRVTSFTYDGLGNLVKTTTPDGAEAQIDVAWGGHGLYSVTKTETNRPDRVTYYDALGRDLRGGIKRFDGQWQYVDKEYDSNGRVSRISLPFRDVQAAYWNTYSYDEYGRPLSLVEASGKNSSWAYDGVSVTTVKDGIASTRTTDASGNVISVSDAGGTITYTLRNDGQPSSVTAPGNVVTSFSYDGYGRRIKIEDPSAGIQIDSCVWNSDGSSVQTHTNPNGSIITYKDKYGRTTSVERPGEYNTTYAYDDDGRLISEQSTNGTGAEYTYDNLDRVVTSREIVPDGKWLRKNYGYGSHGELLSVQYVSQDGAITTENFAYANGHNTGITLQDGTIVYNLVSENDLGMTTEIISGGVDREYGFTAFGLPAYRKINDGNLQDFTYQFDPLTGNLLSRTDGLNNKVETFGYDGLNRLTSIGNRVIAYADNGNITSIGGVGAMDYGTSSRPYQITALHPESEGLVPSRVQNVSYTCYNRPSILTEGGRSAAFTYDGDGNRVKMYVADGSTQLLTRYYLGGRYEFDQTSGGTKERFYLGGDAYSAPMVLQRENGGNWVACNIGRDYLGNITHIATLNGTLVAEYSYDPWGRLRDPETLEIYAAGEEPELFLGRGFTGHEHLTWFGLINMNARLYDPLLGRFLSPDPYVQAPDFTQNFNRYSYALNNPLKFTDDSGEFWNLIIGAVVGGIGNVISNWKSIKAHGFWSGVGYFAVGAAVGVASAAGAGWVAGATKAAGVWAGALVGATSGAVSGAATSSLTTIGNNIISGKTWAAGLKSSALSGALWGAVSGAISGGIKGYKYAKDNKANPWTNEIDNTETTYDANLKSGVSTQPDPSKHCYAYSAEYADSGHGNHKAAEFVAAHGNRDGGDFRILKKVSKAEFRGYFDSEGAFGIIRDESEAFKNNLIEMAGTITNDGRKHWVNIVGALSYKSLSWFGGKTVNQQVFKIWNPIGGAISHISTYNISDITVFNY